MEEPDDTNRSEFFYTDSKQTILYFSYLRFSFNERGALQLACLKEAHKIQNQMDTFKGVCVLLLITNCVLF